MYHRRAGAHIREVIKAEAQDDVGGQQQHAFHPVDGAIDNQLAGHDHRQHNRHHFKVREGQAHLHPHKHTDKDQNGGHHQHHLNRRTDRRTEHQLLLARPREADRTEHLADAADAAQNHDTAKDIREPQCLCGGRERFAQRVADQRQHHAGHRQCAQQYPQLGMHRMRLTCCGMTRCLVDLWLGRQSFVASAKQCHENID